MLGQAVTRDVLPGVHWNPPWPFGRVVVAKTATNFIMPIGYRFLEGAQKPSASDLWLTGDTNVVQARLSIQYTIPSLADFELCCEAPREVLRRAGERMATRFFAQEDVEAILTTRRQELQRVVRQGVQEVLNRTGTGIIVQSVTIQELAPPVQGDVRKAFQEVQSARADRERLIHEARAQRAQILAEVAGEAERVRNQALAARHRRIAIAEGEAQRFLAIAREHARAPHITEQRLYFEAIERLLPKLETYVVEPTQDGKVNLRVVK